MQIGEVWTYHAVRTDVDLDGYDVEAIDGGIGTVDEATREAGASYLVVDTGPWIFGKRVLLPAGVIERIDTTERRVFVNRSRDEIKAAPEYDAELGFSPAFRERIGSYYAVAEPGVRLPARSESAEARSSSSSRPSRGESGRRTKSSATRTSRGRGSSGSSSRSSSGERTRDELYEEAKRLDIPGRSKMNKRGLAQAIARRSGRASSGSRSQRSSSQATGTRRRTRSGGGAQATPIEVQAFLDGVSYPKRRGDLLREAERSGAGRDVRTTLERLPDQRFESPIEVSEAIGKQS